MSYTRIFLTFVLPFFIIQVMATASTVPRPWVLEYFGTHENFAIGSSVMLLVLAFSTNWLCRRYKKRHP
jgi:positive regulator of sigma E activity